MIPGITIFFFFILGQTRTSFKRFCKFENAVRLSLLVTPLLGHPSNNLSTANSMRIQIEVKDIS
jgi:hypothetical protein